MSNIGTYNFEVHKTRRGTHLEDLGNEFQVV